MSGSAGLIVIERHLHYPSAMGSAADIKRRRHELRLSRATASQLAGVSERTWMRIETDEAVLANCRETTLVAMAQALQWPVSRLTKPTEAKDHFVSEASVDGEVVAGEARITFGDALRDRREALGLSASQFAALAKIADVDLTSVESGKSRLKPEEFERIRERFPDDSELYNLWLSSRTIVYDFALLGANNRIDLMLNDLFDLEARCREMFWNCPQAVPGFAQTPAYTEQWLRRTTNMGPAGIDAAIAVNDKRVHSFIFKHPACRVVLHFGFQYAIVDKRVMENQIKHLITLSSIEGVEIKVLKPYSAPSRALFGSWGVIDKAMMHAQNLNGAQTNASPHIVGFFIEQFEDSWADHSLFMPIEDLLPL